MDDLYLSIKTWTWNRDNFGLFDYENKLTQKYEWNIDTSFQLMRNAERCIITKISPAAQDNRLLIVQKIEDSFEISQGDHTGLWTTIKLKKHELKEEDIIKIGRESLIVKKICGRVTRPNISLELEVSPGEKCCRICCSEETIPSDPLISPCKCSGSMKYTHYTCLKSWLKSKVTSKSVGRVSTYVWNEFHCEVCKENLPDFFYFKGEKLPLVEIEYPNGPYIVLEEVKEGRQTLYVVGVDEMQKVCIGRESVCELRLSDMSVSRMHAMIVYKDNKFLLMDNKSKFGTLVKSCKEVTLRLGDKGNFQIGRTLVVVEVKRPRKCCFGGKIVPVD